MGYHILHRHGSYNKGRASYIKLNRKPLKSRKSAKNWIKKNTIGGSYRIVSASKVKRIGKGLYTITTIAISRRKGRRKK